MNLFLQKNTIQSWRRNWYFICYFCLINFRGFWAIDSGRLTFQLCEAEIEEHSTPDEIIGNHKNFYYFTYLHYILCNLYWLFNTCINFQNHVVLAKRQNTKWLSRDYGLIKLTQKIFQWANGYSISQTLLELPTVLDTGVY